MLNRLAMWTLPALLILCGGLTSRAAAQDDPTPEEVIRRHLEAVGGETKLKDVENVRSVARMEMESVDGGGTIDSYVSRGRYFSEIEMEFFGQSMTMKQGINGEVVWQDNPQLGGLRVLEGAERAQLMDDNAKPFPELGWLENSELEITYAGTETVDGNETHRLDFVDKDGGKVSRFFDVESGLLVQITRSQATPMGDVEVTVLLSDYREVEGIKVPHHQAMSMYGEPVFTATLEVMEINGDIDESVFELPEGIREEVDR